MKNGSDTAAHAKFRANAFRFAVQMQKAVQKLYEFGAELDADKHGCGGFARMIRENPPNPLNSRSILRLRRSD